MASVSEMTSWMKGTWIWSARLIPPDPVMASWTGSSPPSGRGQGLMDIGQELLGGRPHIGVMTAIIGEKDLRIVLAERLMDALTIGVEAVALVEHDGLDGGRAYIHTNANCGHDASFALILSKGLPLWTRGFSWKSPCACRFPSES